MKKGTGGFLWTFPFLTSHGFSDKENEVPPDLYFTSIFLHLQMSLWLTDHKDDQKELTDDQKLQILHDAKGTVHKEEKILQDLSI